MERLDRLSLSLDNAVRFMRLSVNPDGFWSDFLTLAGESVYWVSGYVGHALARSAAPRVEEVRQLLQDVGSRLLERQGEDGGWSYGPGVPSDADSTSWCLLFLSRLGTQGAVSRERAVRFLLRHQSPLDGGFRTYAEPKAVGRYMMLDEGVSFEGWSSSQMCVTPVAAGALTEAGSTVGLDKALGYIRGGQAEEGFWEPYWWSDRLYATAHCIELLRARRTGGDAGLMGRAQEWIAKTQLANGAWGDSSEAAEVPFSTALALSGLMAGPRRDFSDNIERGVEWLQR